MADQAVSQVMNARTRIGPFTPLRHKNYRLLWTGLIVSNTGSWMQFTALGYLMDQLTFAPVYLGLLGLFQALPRLLFAFLGGVLADRMDRRRVLLVTNVISMLSASLLAGLTYLRLIEVWHILAIATFNSLVHSFDMPARQSLTPALVPHREILQAVSLNSMAFNGAGVLGPAFAGVMISLVGTHGAFVVNALTYVAVIWALTSMRLPVFVLETRVPLIQDIRDGLALLIRHKDVLLLLVIVAAISFFGRPYIRLMPAVARELLGVGPEGLGILQASPGMGTILAVFATSWAATRLAHGTWLLGGAFTMGLTVTLFALSHEFALSVALLIAIGLSQSAAMATANTLLQTTVAPNARGRAMGLFGTVAFGMMALGTLPAGALAEVIGLSSALALGGVILMLVILLIAWRLPAIRRLSSTEGQQPHAQAGNSV